MNRAFVGLGTNAEHPRQRLEQALVAMEAVGLRVAAVATPVSGPYVGPDGKPVPGAPDVLNTVAEVGTTLEPQPLLEVLQKIENEAGRVRGRGPVRTLDLDLLDVEGQQVISSERLRLPHPRATQRAFVLEPWVEIAPEVEVTGTRRTVLRHDALLRRHDPTAYAALRREPPLVLPEVGAPAQVLRTRADLHAWRRASGRLTVVPTMGALHAGHASLVRRARAWDHVAVLVTVFVNPLQFGPKEDLARYPRTLEDDLVLLRATGADAVYVPDAADLYPEGFSTFVVPEGPAQGYEGAIRPGHFRGVATVVLKLILRTLPRSAWFGQKDAQQVSVIQRLIRDLDLPTEWHVAPTVRDVDGLALSSRNRFLSPAERAQASALPAALADAADRALRGEADARRMLEPGRARLTAAGLSIDYFDLVEPRTFTPLERLGSEPALVVAAVRAGTTRLLDNRWVVVP